MLYVYDDINNLPADKEFIRDVEAWFIMPSKTNSYIDIILKDIEHGSYFDKSTFIDRFGINLYCSFMSTGAKAAILTAVNQDYIISMLECGWNVYECILNNKIPGNIYVPDIQLLPVLQCYDNDIEFMYNGKVYTSMDDFNRKRVGINDYKES